MEQRANIKFCVKLKKTFDETFELLKQVHGDDCLPQAQAYDWFSSFLDGRESIEDDLETNLPQSSTNCNNNIERVRQILSKDPNVTCRMLAEELGVCKDSIHVIFYESLNKRKVCSRFVPNSLTEEQKQARILHAEDIIKTARSNSNFIKNIVTGDEMLCYYYYDSSDEPTPKKVRLKQSSLQTILVCFYDSKGVIYKEFVPNGQNITGIII